MHRMAAAFASFALIASFGIGNMVQANSVMDGLGYMFPGLHDSAWLIGLVLAGFVGRSRPPAAEGIPYEKEG